MPISRKEIADRTALARLELERVLGSGGVFALDATNRKYGSDETEDLFFPPDLIVRPTSTEEVQSVMRIADKFSVPVTPRGAGTGLSGGALPVCGGIALSLERMSRILEIDTRNLMAVVQPGAITEVFQNSVEELGLFYPPDPASRGSCMIGGNLAECSGGPRAVKYGVTKDYVCGVEAVLPNGNIVRHGGKLLKNVTGYNLSQLLVGSEGTLAVITEVTFRLIPLPRIRELFLISYPDLDGPARTVPELFIAGIVPSACEFMERDAILASEEHLGVRSPCHDAEGLLIVEIDAMREAELGDQAERICEIAMKCGATDVVMADTSEKQKEIWRLRRSTGEAVKKLSVYKEEDTVVPRAALPDLVRGVKLISTKYNLRTVCYGHAGDGNLHVNILRMNLTDHQWNHMLPRAIEEIFSLTVGLGGTISGEHGIGFSQKNYLNIAFKPEDLELMSSIKKAFDPKGILNPGKLFPDAFKPELFEIQPQGSKRQIAR